MDFFVGCFALIRFVVSCGGGRSIVSEHSTRFAYVTKAASIQIAQGQYINRPTKKNENDTVQVWLRLVSTGLSRRNACHMTRKPQRKEMEGEKEASCPSKPSQMLHILQQRLPSFRIQRRRETVPNEQAINGNACLAPDPDEFFQSVVVGEPGRWALDLYVLKSKAVGGSQGQ
jgi:hypothetical protein